METVSWPWSVCPCARAPYCVRVCVCVPLLTTVLPRRGRHTLRTALHVCVTLPGAACFDITLRERRGSGRKSAPVECSAVLTAVSGHTHCSQQTERGHMIAVSWHGG